MKIFLFKDYSFERKRDATLYESLFKNRFQKDYRVKYKKPKKQIYNSFYCFKLYN